MFKKACYWSELFVVGSQNHKSHILRYVAPSLSRHRKNVGTNRGQKRVWGRLFWGLKFFYNIDVYYSVAIYNLNFDQFTINFTVKIKKTIDSMWKKNFNHIFKIKINSWTKVYIIYNNTIVNIIVVKKSWPPKIYTWNTFLNPFWYPRFLSVAI